MEDCSPGSPEDLEWCSTDNRLLQKRHLNQLDCRDDIRCATSGLRNRFRHVAMQLDMVGIR